MRCCIGADARRHPREGNRRGPKIARCPALALALRTRHDAHGLEVSEPDPAAFRPVIEEQLGFWKRIITEANIRLDG
jgi:hypothetical protein